MKPAQPTAQVKPRSTQDLLKALEDQKAQGQERTGNIQMLLGPEMTEEEKTIRSAELLAKEYHDKGQPIPEDVKQVLQQAMAKQQAAEQGQGQAPQPVVQQQPIVQQTQQVVPQQQQQQQQEVAFEAKSAQSVQMSVSQYVANNHPYGIGIILGVGRGNLALQLLQTWQTSPGLYLCDPYIHIWRGYDSPDNLSDKDHQMVFENLRNQLQPYQNRYSIVRDFSNAFAITYKQTPGSPPTSLVWVDTMPTYVSITRDLTDWYTTLAPNGVIAGPSYETNEVRKAVHDFARSVGKQVQLFGADMDPTGVWFIMKQ